MNTYVQMHLCCMYVFTWIHKTHLIIVHWENNKKCIVRKNEEEGDFFSNALVYTCSKIQHKIYIQQNTPLHLHHFSLFSVNFYFSPFPRFVWLFINVTRASIVLLCIIPKKGCMYKMPVYVYLCERVEIILFRKSVRFVVNSN